MRQTSSRGLFAWAGGTIVYELFASVIDPMSEIDVPAFPFRRLRRQPYGRCR